VTRFGIDAVTFLHLARHDLRPHPDHQLVAPNSLRSAALQQLLVEVGESLLDDGSALAIHDRITELKVRLLGDRVSRRTAWQIARAQNWATLEVAEYLAVTWLQADALATIDPDMAAAAAGIVPLAPVQRLFAPD
jgi:hypothetical protein